MKNAKRLCGILVIVLVASMLCMSLVACNPSLDPETRTFSMSIQTPDGVFNPFFSTSAYDSSVISMTQISMFNTDKKGQLVAGLSEPTVALDYTQQAVLVDDPSRPMGGATPVDDEQASHTDYEILLKNGIKFSDGSDLTIKDVLFNLYVYLDPVFTGSATIYSTDIVGLTAYRTGDDNTGDTGLDEFEQNFYAAADIKLRNLVSWVKYFTGLTDRKDNPNQLTEWAGKTWDDKTFEYNEVQGVNTVKVKFEYYRKKVNEVAALYMNELNTDWNAINMDDYKRDPNKDAQGRYEEETYFTQPWQVFLVSDMARTELYRHLNENDPESALVKTIKGKYILNAEAAQEAFEEIVPESVRNMEEGEEKEEAIKKAFILEQFGSVFGNDYTETVDTYGIASYAVNVPSMNSSNFGQVVQYWQTASTIYDNLIAEAKTDYFEDSASIEHTNIKGITVYKTSTFKGKQLNGEHYVLKIRINKVDPKALINFAFTVAPMKYYSNSEQIKLFNDDFNAWEAAGAHADDFNTMVNHFGVKYADSDFMNDVVRSNARIGVPVGAGPYQASNQNNSQNLNEITGTGSNGFWNANMIYYTRNENFWTVGADGGSEESSQLHNAYIKKIVYRVVASDQIISSLARNNIDFGDPSATSENKTELQKAGLTVVQTQTAGYGYIGINPRYVPELGVRRAIMKAMDIDLMISDYYKDGFAERIYRPMSMASWAYPDGVGVYSWGSGSEQNLEFDANGKDIEALVRSEGYEKNAAGLFVNSNGKTLDIKFTIAGGSDDHPAYKCFLKAQEILNAHGFNIQVVTSAQALSDLSAGKLAVWAAAWSSAIDPDMYQVYHINSQASSTNNWGYKQIKADQTTYSDEYKIIVALSEEIDNARETNDQDNRKAIYATCLDYVMQLAVELPTYQRNDIVAYNPKVIDSKSLPVYDPNNPERNEVGPYYGLLSRIWDVKYV